MTAGAGGKRHACSVYFRSLKSTLLPIGQAAPAGAGHVPDHVAASAMFLGLVYPGRGLETSVRKEHLDSMTTADYVKVWKVRYHSSTQTLRAASLFRRHSKQQQLYT